MTRPGILQFGATGQLGRELARRAGAGLHVMGRDAVDFANRESIRNAILERPDTGVVINAVAYTAVDKAESEENLACLINADAVRVLAHACAERGVPLVHISTDYVYDGEKPEPYVETDRTNPLGVYGRTKLAGEDAIRESGVRHVILRTSWVYSPFGSNFVKTMLRLGAEREQLRVVADQRGAPTAAGDLAEAVIRIAEQLTSRQDSEACGTFHYAGAGFTSWYGFADAILAKAKTGFPVKAKVMPIATSEYPTAARRPRNSCLDCSKIREIYGIEAKPWQSALATVLEELRQGGAS